MGWAGPADWAGLSPKKDGWAEIGPNRSGHSRPIKTFYSPLWAGPDPAQKFESVWYGSGPSQMLIVLQNVNLLFTFCMQLNSCRRCREKKWKATWLTRGWGGVDGELGSRSYYCAGR